MITFIVKISYSQIKLFQRVNSLIIVHTYFRFWGEEFRRLTFNWSAQCYEKELFFRFTWQFGKRKLRRYKYEFSYYCNIVLL